MFYDNEISQGIMQKKYLQDNETPRQFIDRVVSIFSPEIQPWAREIIENADFLPAGRTLAAAGLKGKRKMSMSNCYVIPTPDDNIESIFDTAKYIARISSYGGGCGLALDNLRPKDSKVNNSARTSTGAVSFLKLFDITGGIIGQAGRRAALMVGLRCDHPDIYEFLRIKENNEKLASMNISIKFTDEFMKAVCEHRMFKLHFESEHEVIDKEIDAAKFFEDFCKVNWDYGDPGCIFIDRVRNYQLLAGYEDYPIDISNPCVTGDTLILTDSGYKRIADLVGRKTKIWNGSEWSVVSPRITGYNQKMLHITTSNGMTLDCTTYHKFIMNDGKRIKAKDLNVGDKLAKWDYPIIYGGIDANGHDAYTNGFYSGDGTKGLSEIMIYGEKHKVIDRLAVDHLVHCGDKTRVVLSEVPIGKSYVPSNEMSVRYRLDWLAGLIDSDGTLNDPSGSVSISSTDREFLSNVQLMLTTLGCHSSIGLMHEEADRELPLNDGTGRNGVYHCQDCYRLVISGWYVHKLVELGLNLSRIQVTSTPNRNAGRFVTITSIVEIPDADVVYCFNEPINHSGIFNGIMTAQCAEFFGTGGNSCNLGSINLYNMIDNKFSDNAQVNWDKLAHVVGHAVTMLDEILDYGYDMQPLDLNREVIRDWRSIGLGVFGLADALVAMKIRYGSQESRQFVSDVMEFILGCALGQSANLAKTKGTFAKYDWEKTSKSPLIQMFMDSPLYDKIKQYGLRNGSLLSIAPTGTISLFAGKFTGGVEPMYQVAYKRTSHATEDAGKTFFVYARGVEDMLHYHNIDPQSITVDEIKKRFPFIVESHEVPYIERVALQSIMQDYVDNAISSTVNLPNEATWKDIKNIYVAAWEQGLKGITVFRDGCKRGNILGVSDKKPTAQFNVIEPVKRRDKYRVDGSTFKQRSSCVPSMYVTVNKEGDNIFEVFTNASGGCQANINTITRLVSLALRSGIKVSNIIEELRANKCPACQALRRQGQTLSLSCGNAIADAMEAMIDTVDENIEHDAYLTCPECGKKTLRPEGKCFTCSNCGYSKCD